MYFKTTPFVSPYVRQGKSQLWLEKSTKYPRQEIEPAGVQETSEILGIDNLLDRQPRQLSGEQSRREALGRAIVPQSSGISPG